MTGPGLVNHLFKRGKASGAATLLCILALAACGAGTASADGPTKANPRLTTAVLRSGQVSLTAEIAKTDRERETGLMFRKALADGQGMLFVFDADQVLAFWMKNTSLSLSVAYLSSDGTIREIHDLEPRSLAAVTSERSVRYALEVPRGWFDRVGLKVGDRFELPRD
jgi:uncharacterized membrane protein (UPF0127 family)